MENDSDFFSEDLTAKERELYNRQFRLEGWSQSIVKNSRVLIAGVGGLGCEIAKNLAMLGVGHLDLVDLDVIEHSNLNRQILFIDAKMGQPKALAAAKMLRKINPNITIEGYSTSLERLDPAIYNAADVIIGGLDSMNARLNLNAQAVRFKKPLIDGGVSGYHGHFYTIFPYENACFECNPLPSVEDDDMAACTVVGIPRKRVHCVFKGNMAFQDKFKKDPDPTKIKDIEFIQKIANDLSEKHNFPPPFSKADIIKIIDRHDPGIITINAIISAIQSHETIKILHWLRGNNALGEPIRTYTVFNGMTMKFYSIEKKRRINCTQCGEQVVREDIHTSRNEPCQKLVDALVDRGHDLDPEMVPILTTIDFNDVKEIDLEQSIKKNGLRDLELITVAGFKKGEILLTLRIN
ncbi:MAG: ThiF family adenylyltransferase [Promethearchaeota archaeon]